MDTPMSTVPSASGSPPSGLVGVSDGPPGPCRQEALLAQISSANSPAEVARVVRVALESPNVLVFGEFLDLQSVQQLANTEYAKDLDLLKLFAYGTLRDYIGKESEYPPLSENQLRKLRQLSVASLAARCRSLPYAELMAELGLSSRRQLEDLVIEAIYADVVRGKLDQKNACFQVDQALARDVPGDLSSISRLLSEWCSSCEAALGAAERAAEQADTTRQRHQQRKIVHDERVVAIMRGQRATTSAQDAMGPEAQGKL